MIQGQLAMYTRKCIFGSVSESERALTCFKYNIVFIVISGFPGNNLYASVDKRNLDAKRKMYSSNPCVVQQIDESINVVEGPPVPVRGYTRYLLFLHLIMKSNYSLVILLIMSYVKCSTHFSSRMYTNWLSINFYLVIWRDTRTLVDHVHRCLREWAAWRNPPRKDYQSCDEQ